MSRLPPSRWCWLRTFLATSFSNSTATVTATEGGSGGNLQGTTPINAVNGVASFSNLNITNAGAGQSIIFASSGLTSVTNSGLTITAWTPTQLAVTQQPSASATAGAAFGTQPKVTVRDAYGNSVSSNTVIQQQ